MKFKTIFLYLFSIATISACEKQDKISQHYEDNKEQYTLIREQRTLYRNYVAPLPQYLDLLIKYQKKKVYPNGVKPDNYFLSRLYNALYPIAGRYNIDHCSPILYSSKGKLIYRIMNTINPYFEPLVIDEKMILLKYAKLVPDYSDKALMINALLTHKQDNAYNDLNNGKIHIEQAQHYREVEENNFAKLIEEAEHTNLNELYNPKVVFCSTLNLNDIKMIKENFRNLYQRYPLTESDRLSISLMTE